MRRNKLFDWDDEEPELWELLSWDLPGLKPAPPGRAQTRRRRKHF